MRFLIVNGDDFNLTEGISRAISQAHDRGILTSTSVMINMPLSKFQLQGLVGRKNLGIGLHLNATFGFPVSGLERRSALVDSSGRFVGKEIYAEGHFGLAGLKKEFKAQIRLFFRKFRRLPDHLNTHHHIHAFAPVFRIISQLSEGFGIPVRRVDACAVKENRKAFQTTDYLFGNLSPAGHWRAEALKTILENLPCGTSELICHPGFLDRELVQKSSFREEREAERKLFSSAFSRELVKKNGIHLINFRKLDSSRML